jgi:hypothetical protein
MQVKLCVKCDFVNSSIFIIERETNYQKSLKGNAYNNKHKKQEGSMHAIKS